MAEVTDIDLLWEKGERVTADFLTAHTQPPTQERVAFPADPASPHGPDPSDTEP